MKKNKLLIPGFKGLLNFLQFLEEQKIHYGLKHSMSDAISVSFMTVGMRFEADFFEDHATFNFYEGDEQVSRDEDKLMELLRESWDLKE